MTQPLPHTSRESASSSISHHPGARAIANMPLNCGFFAAGTESPAASQGLPTLADAQRGLALASLRPVAASTFDAAVWLRDCLHWARSKSFCTITLDATMPGLRPRELDTSARREISVLLKRHELSLAGVDCFVPPAHLLDAAKQTRAMEALEQACNLVESLRSVWFISSSLSVGTTVATSSQRASDVAVCTLLPAQLDKASASHLAHVATKAGTLIADCTHETPLAQCGESAGWARALDPRLVLAGAKDFASVVLGASPLAQARLPLAAVGLDITTYLALLHVRGWTGPVVLDATGVR